MLSSTALGPIVKAKETISDVAGNAPSVGELLTNRTRQFDRYHAIVPSTARPGESLSLTLQVWDQCERLFDGFEGSVRLDSTDPEATFPETVSIRPTDGGFVEVDAIQFETAGIQYLTLTDHQSGEQFVSNPVRVAPDHERDVYWGDIHLHSTLSDGSGDPEQGYRFGRDVMALDVAAYTDHDTMGFFIPPTWQQKRMHRTFFAYLCDLSAAYNDDGSFVTLPGYEWTKQPNVGGHINVYFSDPDEATLYDSIDPESDTFEKLWSCLRGWQHEHDSDVLTIPHHSAESTYPFDFEGIDYDDQLSPLVEVYSQWGSSERPGPEGNQFPIDMGQGEMNEPGYYVQDALQLGHKVGMMASADYHGPHPGHSLIHTRPHLPAMSEWREYGLGWGNIWRVWDEPSYPGGLTAFLTPELSRDAIFQSLQERSVYATTQPHRILVDFKINGVDVAAQRDAVLVDSADEIRQVSVEVAGTEPISTVDIVKNNESWRSIDGTDDPDSDLDAYTTTGVWRDESPITGMEWDSERGTDGDVYYARVEQATADRFPGMAWVGPIWVESH